MSTRQRSHDGCWTCKSRRRKCDLARPACLACRQRGLSCEGYEVRLRWGSGIASRGRFTGAEEPVATSVPVRAKGRRRDLSRERRLSRSEGTSSVGSPTGGRDEVLFQEFISSGIQMLHSTSVKDTNYLAPRLPGLCQQSKALYAICLALQASMTPDIQPPFYEYFDAALNQFRVELAKCVTDLGDGTLTAGLLLCSIGLMHGSPWTMHLHGMHNILQVHGLGGSEQRTEYRNHLLEAMGVMDLPSFAVGRQNPSLGVWRRYCRGASSDGIEVVSGLPRSLLDIFSCVGEGATEEEFWDWPGTQGTMLQCQLWEAYRLAGMLTVRYGQLHCADGVPREGRPRVLPQTEVLVMRILSCLDAVCRGSAEPEWEDSLVVNAIHYPIFVVGLQRDVLNENEKQKQVIRRCFALRQSRPEVGKDGSLLLDLLEAWWCSSMTSIHDLARSQGMELGLH